MNPVNATALYVSASRLVLNYDPGDPQSFTEINKLLPYFRQSLSCCVCGEDLSFVPGTMSRLPPPTLPPRLPGALRTASGISGLQSGEHGERIAFCCVYEVGARVRSW
uniref:Uncharacterized protein n=1 Tax=Strix occidentalis caurina TaxID=311401 RepID=A0A8D0FU61_STROC